MRDHFKMPFEAIEYCKHLINFLFQKVSKLISALVTGVEVASHDAIMDEASQLKKKDSLKRKTSQKAS